MKCSRSSIRVPEDGLIKQNERLSVFLCIEFQKWRSQLLSASARWNKAKSKQSYLKSCLSSLVSFLGFSTIVLACLIRKLGYRVRILNRGTLNKGTFNAINNVIKDICTLEIASFNPTGSCMSLAVISLTFLIGLRILLIKAGIEMNPGPPGVVRRLLDSLKCLKVISQNVED